MSSTHLSLRSLALVVMWSSTSAPKWIKGGIKSPSVKALRAFGIFSRKIGYFVCRALFFLAKLVLNQISPRILAMFFR